MQKIPVFVAFLLSLAACSENHNNATREAIDQLQLKKGGIVLCGVPDKEFGSLDFQITGSRQLKTDFNTAVELLHSFEYDEAEKVFAKILH